MTSLCRLGEITRTSIFKRTSLTVEVASLQTAPADLSCSRLTLAAQLIPLRASAAFPSSANLRNERKEKGQL